MGIDTDKLTAILFIGNDVINRHFCGGACRGRDGDDRHARMTGGADAFQTADIFKLRIINNNADRLAGILW